MYDGATYFTDTDNWGGGAAGSTADGDLDESNSRIGNGSTKYPIEFKIEDVDQLPTVSAQLLVRGYDVDEYKNNTGGEWDRVYMSANPDDIRLGTPYTSWPSGWNKTDAYKQEFKQKDYIGALSGQNEIWNTSAFSISPSDFGKIAEGDNYVGISIHHYYLANTSVSSWVTEIDWAQLVIDGGSRTSGEIPDAGIKVENGKITLDTTLLPKTNGNFVMEANVIQKVQDANGNSQELNLAVATKDFPDVSQGDEQSWKPVLSNGSIDPGTEYIVNIMLFEAREDGEPGEAQHVLSFSTYDMKAADIEKRALKNTELPFALEDFQSAFYKNSGVSGAQDIPNGDNLQVVTIHSLPEAQDGKLLFNGAELTADDLGENGFAVKATDIGKLSFAPASTMDYSGEFEWSGYGQGKATVNRAKAVIKMNYEPTIENFTVSANKGDDVEFDAEDFSRNAFQDINDGDALTKIKIVSLPEESKGKLVLKDGGSVTEVTYGQEIQLSDIDSLVFIPEEGVSGAVEFEWNGYDGYQYAADNKTVTIAINAPPVAANIGKTGLMGDKIRFGNDSGNHFAASYSDADNDALDHIEVVLPDDFAGKGRLYYTVTVGEDSYGQPVTESVYAAPGESTIIPKDKLGSLQFDPAEELGNGSFVEFEWYAYDGKQYSEEPGIVTIAYNGIPAADANIAEMQEDEPSVRIELSGTDMEDGRLKVQIFSGPLNGKLEPADPEDPYAGEWIYTPDAGFTGTDSFYFIVTDEEGQTSEPASVTVHVHKALDGWVGNKEQGDSSVLPAVPGYPLTLTAVSTLSAERVEADVNGEQVDLIWINQATSAEDGYKLWQKTNTVLPSETEAGQYTVTFTARDANGDRLPSETSNRLSDNDFEVLNAEFTLVASPEQILGDGNSVSELTAILKDIDGMPIAGVEVTFDAAVGSFPDGNKAVTDENGFASVQYRSAAISGVDSQTIPVTATVLDLDKGLSASAHIDLTFLPAQVKGVVTSGAANEPVANATVRVTLDLNGDGAIDPEVDFDRTVVTDANGSYAIAVPKGNAVYDVTVTRTINVGGMATPVSFAQKASVGVTSGSGDESYDSEKTVTGVMLFKQPNGLTALVDERLLNRTNVYLRDANGAYVTENGKPKAFELTEQGVFNATGLAIGEYTLEARYAFEDGTEVTYAKLNVGVNEEGELNISQLLVDPYGTVTNKVTGAYIEGAEVTLYYADTERNAAAGLTAGTPVELPELPGFAPNDNASPEQLTDGNGFYAYMVYPETDYYLVVSKSGFRTFTSPTISVDWDIVKYDVQLSPRSSGGSPSNDSEPKVSLAISTNQTVVKEGSESVITVDYKNESDVALAKGTITVKVPEGAEIVDADGGTVNGNEISWTVTDLAGGKSGSFQFKVKWSLLDAAEQEFSFSGTFEADGSSSAGASASSTAKIKVYSERFGNLSHQRYILGMPDGEFKLGNSLTRAELAAIVARLTENVTLTGDLPFNDIRDGHWATNYIRIAVKHGYFGGFADGTFRPDQAVTRGELAAVMSRYLELNPGTPVDNHFADSEGHWAEKEIEALYLGHYLNGYEDGTFRPSNKIRRDEAVTMINRMLYRGPLEGLAPVFPDVPESHWAFGDVQEATVSHESVRNEDGSETFVNRIEDDVR